MDFLTVFGVVFGIFVGIVGVVGVIIAVIDYIKKNGVSPQLTRYIVGGIIGMLLFTLIASWLILQVTSGKATATTQSSSSPTANTSLQNSNTPTATQAQPSPTPSPLSGGLPCTVNIGNWTTGTSDWKILNGTVLVSDGSSIDNGTGGPTIAAPCQFDNANYAVETTIQVLGDGSCFGISVRGNPDGGNGPPGVWHGYNISFCGSDVSIGYPSGDYDSFPHAAFSPKPTDVDIYRIEANGNKISVFINGNFLLSWTENTYLTGSQVGLWCEHDELQVTSFKVVAL
jgi:hypothetical protein